MNKHETKYALTAQKMDEAFLKLLGEKEFPYITVKEICQRANVNRSTFYLHYETINDLLIESVKLVNKRFLDYFDWNPQKLNERLQNGPKEELYFITPEYLTPYLSFIQSNKRLFSTMVEQASILGLDHNYGQLFDYVLEPIMEHFHVPKVNRHYVIMFYINGIMAIVAEWLKNDCSDSIECITEIIQHCIMKPNQNQLTKQ